MSEYYAGKFPGEHAASAKVDAPKTLLDEFAMVALNALIIAGLDTDAWEDYDDLADSAYKIAAAAERKRKELPCKPNSKESKPKPPKSTKSSAS